MGRNGYGVALSWGSRCILEGMQVWDAMAGQVEPIKTIHISDRGHFGATRLRHEEERVEALGYVDSTESGSASEPCEP